MATFQGGENDFHVFMKTLPQADYVMKFDDFIKIFLLGDIYALMATSPFAASRSSVEYLESEFQQNEELREKYFGDPVKRAMFVQAMRRWPYMVAIPVVFSLAVFIASLLKLTIPFISRFTSLLEVVVSRSASNRKKRDILAIGGIADIPSKLSDICMTLCKAIESIEYLTIAGMEQEDGFRVHIPRRSVLFSNYTEASATSNIKQAVDYGRITRDWIQTWSQLLPTFQKCIDQIFRCHLTPTARRGGSSECGKKNRLSACARFLGAFLAPLADMSLPENFREKTQF